MLKYIFLKIKTMPGTSAGAKMPDGISLQEIMKAASLPTANGECSSSSSGGSAEEAEAAPSVACKECGNESKNSRACGGCWQVWYCSKAHQAAGWGKHQRDCKPWKLSKSPDRGRFLIATRDIAPGELLLCDSPILIGPKQITEPVCLGCYRPVEGRYCCKKCGFPMCDSDCEQAEAHEPECEAVSESGTPVKVSLFGQNNSLYECITPLRLLGLRDNHVSLWRRLMTLESHQERRSHTENAAITQHTVVDIITERLKIERYDEELIKKVLGIIDTNAFEIRLPDSSIQGVFGQGAMLEHSCIPNTHRTFDADLNLVVRAAVPIKRGYHLTSCYTEILATTVARQEHLLTSKFFTCRCPRCVDPTELGTYCSAVVCPNCPKSSKPTKTSAAAAAAKGKIGPPVSVVIPSDPLSPSSDWMCITCSTPVDSDYIIRMTSVMAEEADELESTNPTVRTCEQFLEKWSPTFFTNYASLLNIKYVLLHLYGSEEGYELESLSPMHLLRKEALCRQVLAVADSLVPGISRLRGSVLYELYQSIFYKTISMYQGKVIPNEIAKKLAKEGYDALVECARVLSYEPPVQPEGQLGLEAKDEIKQMLKWMKEEGWKTA
ncbi:Zinc finger MYND-type [Trinorchestia longiramus]|nr:Zinc finger MYND-type [Trinorchestia longiramus]